MGCLSLQGTDDDGTTLTSDTLMDRLETNIDGSVDIVRMRYVKKSRRNSTSSAVAGTDASQTLATYFGRMSLQTVL